MVPKQLADVQHAPVRLPLHYADDNLHKAQATDDDTKI